MCIAVSMAASAQVTQTTYSDTATNADTVYATFNVVPSKVTAFQVDLNRISGTITTSGIGLLQGTVNGTSWVDVNTDTLKLANQATNTKAWTITGTSYKGYRVCIRIPSGTQASKATFSYLRRSDE